MGQMGNYGGRSSGSTGGGFFGTGGQDNSSSVRYVCLVCNNKHKGGTCPRCGSKMQRADFQVKMTLEELRKKALYQNSIEIWIGISEEKKIDWVNTDNYQKFIDEFPEDRAEEQSHGEFRYFLKILNVQDSIATAKITGSVFPFAYPQIGDEINIK